ncbi:hypothetical protein VDG1235_433 [Verrucomicrobiia bacterium DG1235]|nr:hypothetical protein VDG1235_433 [Verrucomicrobiae bacterium DG1235]
MNRIKTAFLFVLAFSFACAASAALPRTPSPEGAKVYIISPADGETVGKTFTVQFGLKGMGVAPAGIELPNTGHHHLLINAKSLPDEGVPMPMSESLKHFGKGQTEVDLTLEPGTHTLQLVLGDYLHIPHQPVVASEQITVVVK